jgi:predicted RNA-binding protein YlxR (DUF448 family)
MQEQGDGAKTSQTPSSSASSASAISAISAVKSGSVQGKKVKRKGPPRPKHVPQRTCIACKQVRPKRELIRIVRTPDGHVVLDETGKKSGRGAYLCARRSCWEPAVRKGLLEREFEVTLLPEDRAALEAYIETLPVEPAPAKPAKSAKATKTPKLSRGQSATHSGE